MNKKKLQAITLPNIILIIGILAGGIGFYYYSLTQSRIENRRKEAQNELLKLKGLIEQQAVNGSVNQPDGTSVVVNSTMDVIKILQANTSVTPITTSNNYYNIVVNSVSTQAGGYSLTATPPLNSPQAKDIIICQTIVLTVSADGSYNKTPADCWK